MTPTSRIGWIVPIVGAVLLTAPLWLDVFGLTAPARLVDFATYTGIAILGYLFSTSMIQAQRRRTERLREAHEEYRRAMSGR
jgi:hypothetical protein